MRRISALVFALLLPLFLSAQNDISIGLVMPYEEIHGVNPDAFTLLQSKLEKMLTTCGVASDGGDFVMYPVINIIEEDLIEGGIKNYFKIKIELSLNVSNLSSKTLFSSEIWPLTGTAERNNSDAVRNAFTQLKGTDLRFKAFMDNAKNKICKYYEENKNEILTKASTLASTGDYEEAIAFLSGYPSQVSGYSEAHALLVKIYTQYINTNAARILNESRSSYAIKDYERAVMLASQIPVESSYYNDAKTLINQVRSTVDREESEKKATTMKALELAADVEKSRINAISSVAKAYYGRKVVNYNTVVVY